MFQKSAFKVLSNLILLLVLCTSQAAAAPDNNILGRYPSSGLAESIVSWTVSYATPVSQIRSLAVYNNKLYAGGFIGQSNAHLFVYDGTSWSDLNFSPALGESLDMLESLQVYNNRLYIGTRVYSGGVAYSRVYYYDGTTFTQDFSTVGTLGCSGIEDLAVHNNALYAANGACGRGEVFQRLGDDNWSTVGGIISPSGDASRALASFKGSLYAGTGTGGGAKVWRWNDSTWDLSTNITDLFGVNQDGIWSLAASNDLLFAGTAGSPLASSLIPAFDGTTWVTGPVVSGNIKLSVVNGQVWAGAGDGKIYFYNAGSWQEYGTVSNAQDFAEYNGNIYAAGSNGSIYQTISPNTYTAISALGHFTCGITSNGGVKCWGNNVYGQLGHGTNTNKNIPGDVIGLTSGIGAISAGVFHICALTSNGGVKCWGLNNKGQLGDGTNSNRNTPVDVSGLSSGVIAISAGGYHTCALTSGGGVKCWGDNQFGTLGDGTTTSRNTPVDVSDLGSGVNTIAGGGNFHTCVLTNGGGVKCWGYNNFWQLGDGTNTNRNTPVDVSGLGSGVIAISPGGYYTCVLTSSGGVKCWGDNQFGTLGDGTTTSRNTPVDVSGLGSGISSISAGGSHTCALTSGGGVKCWGNNYYGDLGDGTNVNKNIPVDVNSLTSGISSISAGGNHTCALTSGGGVRCWGNNQFGQLGDGTNTNNNVPVDVVGSLPTNYPIILLPGIMGSRLTNTTSCLLRPSGEIWIQQLLANKLRILANFDTLMLNIDSNGNPQPQNDCDSISATGIMDSDPFNYYGGMHDTLVQAGYTVINFPYDWRLSLESNAEKLNDKIVALNAPKVILISHSMGGLLARQYISHPNWATKVDKVITLGSPYWGAPKLAYAMRTGRTGIDNLDKFTWLLGGSLKSLIRNSPGSMELLPSQAFVDQSGAYYFVNGQPQTYDQTLQYFKDHGQNPSLLDQAHTFHNALDNFGLGDKLNGVSYFVLAANQLPTPSIVSENSCGIFKTCYSIPTYSLGDGTVPWVSARLRGIAGDWKGNATVCTMSQVASDHSGMMSDPIVYGLISKILNNQTLSTSDCLETQTAVAKQMLGSLASATPTAFIEVTVEAGGKVSVTDAANHTASLDSDGTIVNDIPLSTFEVLDEMTTITLPVTSTYILTLYQTDTVPGKVRVVDFRTLTDAETFEPYQRAVFVDVPSTVGGIATLSIDYTNGMSSLRLLLDKDGNGSTDQTLPPTSVLDQILSQDYTSPQTDINIAGTQSNGWYVGDIAVTINAEDNPGGTGVAKIDYSLDGGQTFLEYSSSFSLDASVYNQIIARSIDVAGNRSWKLVKASPIVLSSIRADSNPTSAASVNFTVTFSESVTGVDTVAPFNDFTLTTSTGVTGASITGVTPVSGTTYTASVNTGSGHGTIRLDVVDNNSIVDVASNPLGGVAVSDGNFATGEVYTITKPAGGDTTGVFRPSNGLLYLKNANTTGFADVAINYGTGGDYPIAGDWDGNGTATIGIYRNGSFYLRNSNTLGFADIVFAFGTPGDQPVAGDWDGDGVDTIGVYSNGQFLLRNSNSAGATDMNFYLGNPGDVGIAGDWNGDGLDTTGVFRPSNGIIFLKNANTTGFADVALNYGLSGDMPVTGDWDNDGIDTIGVYRNAQFLLRNSNTIGFADIVFGLGNPGDMPIAGNWDGIP